MSQQARPQQAAVDGICEVRRCKYDAEEMDYRQSTLKERAVSRRKLEDSRARRKELSPDLPK